MTGKKPPALRGVDPAAFNKARGRRNLWLALALFAFAAIVMTVTIVRLSEGSYRMAEEKAAAAGTQGASEEGTP